MVILTIQPDVQVLRSCHTQASTHRVLLQHRQTSRRFLAVMGAAQTKDSTGKDPWTRAFEQLCYLVWRWAVHQL